MEITPNTESGLIGGKPHSEGGTMITVNPTSQVIEAELGEWLICSSAMESSTIHEFKDKTNKEILNAIHQIEGCKYVAGQANVGDFIICKLVVEDDKKRSITGTVKEIINILQSEKACNVTKGNSSQMSDGGGIGDPCMHNGMSEFEIDLWTNYLWWMDSDNYFATEGSNLMD